MIEENGIILEDVKRMLSIDSSVTEFDLDICTHVNSAFFTLSQIGVGPQNPFYITNVSTWSSFETVVPKSIILDYLVLKTRLVFDSPTSGALVEAIKDRISELEFRMNIYTDNGGGVVSG